MVVEGEWEPELHKLQVHSDVAGTGYTEMPAPTCQGIILDASK